MSGSSSEERQVVTAEQAKDWMDFAAKGPWLYDSINEMVFTDDGAGRGVDDVAEVLDGSDQTGELLAAAPDLAYTVVKLTLERDWLSGALSDQESAYETLEQQFLAVSDAHAALVDQISNLAAQAIR